MTYKWIATKTPVVRYREHPTRKNGAVKKDRYYTIRYKINNISKEEGLGWASEGWTEEKAGLKRAELREAYRTGKGCITLKEQRNEQAREKKQKDALEQEEQKKNITLDKFYNDFFISVAKNNKAEHTFASENGYYKNWLAPKLGGKSLRDISLMDLENIKTGLLEVGKSPKTINYIFSILSQILSYAKKIGIMSGDNVSKQLKKIKFDNQRTRFLTIDEANLLLDALMKSSTQLYEISLISLHCGLRAGEIFNLCWSDVDFNNKILTLRNTKNSKTRNIYMTNDVYKMLYNKKDFNGIDSFIFKSRKGAKIKEVSNSFNRVVNILGLNDGITDNRQRVVFHTLRHTYASWLAQMGTDLHVVQKLMGHSNFSMTQRYAHLSPETFKKAIDRFEERIK